MYIVTNNIYPIDVTPPLRHYDVVSNVDPRVPFNFSSVSQNFASGDPQFVQKTSVNLGSVSVMWEARVTYREFHRQ